MAQSGWTISNSGKFSDVDGIVELQNSVSVTEFPRLDKSIAIGLLAALIFTVMAHGAVEPWSVALFELIVLVLLVLWGIKCTLDRHVKITVPAAALPIVALLLLGIFQSVAFMDGAGQRASLSLDVEATRHAVMILGFQAISFIVAANFLVTRERLSLLANVLTVFGATVAAFALIQYFTWDGRFYWLRSTDRSVFGPFVNHNHFAGYMVMVMCVPLGLILKAVRGHVRLVYGFAAALMGTAAIVSGSRSGVMSIAGAMILMTVLKNRFRRSARMHDPFESRRYRLLRIGPIAIITLAMIVGVGWTGATPIVERIGEAIDGLVRSGTADLSRAMIWRDTVPMIRDHPITGAGLGTYYTNYPTYANTQQLFGLDYAHNDYLQVVADCGAVGAIIAVWFIVLLFAAIYRAVQVRDPLLAGWALAAGGGIFAVAIQSVSDSDLQIPSNALLFLILSAVVSSIGDKYVIAGGAADR